MLSKICVAENIRIFGAILCTEYHCILDCDAEKWIFNQFWTVFVSHIRCSLAVLCFTFSLPQPSLHLLAKVPHTKIDFDGISEFGKPDICWMCEDRKWSTDFDTIIRHTKCTKETKYTHRRTNTHTFTYLCPIRHNWECVCSQKIYNIYVSFDRVPQPYTHRDTHRRTTPTEYWLFRLVWNFHIL